ncbi:MAG: arginine decarboxylase [Bdellovibrio sp. CG12_big_fil_rev_8_21_14_0_65_39_13]|nr:MAG: arginine decarboxylase [Bdellovibrio sp. CG22_combo_CG10-13_8_21_14_all_39_27]PIQ62619.1 MAG: arginine decarboxylase [Bdellovibrio sp. CG12_big_fil_rev_8_21_14_0_65_39_13]PIR36974.1 MAG: arginine decarboxylase [Bdellovibrio sp. CG11_big_fil_rev_8_21_14_0_20_39_38]PJB53853.1 MAG: arginine decarboxylase [Bdellovibrio sp. CG_4_9_14_3_um_filter_39_7]
MGNDWTKEDVYRTYNLQNWGEGYFDVDEEGHLVAVPDKGTHKIVINKVVEEMKTQGIKLPAVIRFHDILRQQVRNLNRSFRKVIEDANYQGRYFGVYPVKVNQMREVVEEILDAGQTYDYGLEAGSKPELMAVLAYNTNKNAMTILNGYKDEDYLRLALLGNKLGRKVVVVIEKFSELSRLIKLSKEMNVTPMIGLRGRMAVEGHGRWKSSSGEKAKFGLSISEIIQAVQFCEEQGLKDAIKLFHFHVGSQISDIRTLKDAISEGGRIYAKLHKMGVKLEYFDAGGGLGIDYDGTRSDKDSSMNYIVEEYATDIVWGLKQICDTEGVPHPNIVTESGRMITAHHSCVITNVIDQVKTSQTSFNTSKVTGEHLIVENMRDLEESLSQKNFQQYYNEALQLKEECLNAFKLGILSLEERAKIETIYWKIMSRINVMTKSLEFIPEGLHSLDDDLAPQYLCNFSVFQSIADYWAIDQLLPVVPLNRLNEEPTLNGSIADITCDSDGKMDRFIDRESGFKSTIPLHVLKENEDYLIGIFLTGAYQDVMGDMHNLFGRLNEVHVYSDPEDPAGFYIEEIIRGNNASSVLATMQYNPEYMAQKMKQLVNQEVVRGIIPPREGVRLVDFYEECLSNYTYLMTTLGE